MVARRVNGAAVRGGSTVVVVVVVVVVLVVLPSDDTTVVTCREGGGHMPPTSKAKAGWEGGVWWVEHWERKGGGEGGSHRSHQAQWACLLLDTRIALPFVVGWVAGRAPRKQAARGASKQ